MQKEKRNSWIITFLLAGLFFIGLFYRLYGLNDNHAFWTDEVHVAIFTRAVLERGQPVLTNSYSTGVYQWLQYWLSALSAKIFGLNEFAIRFPSVVFGVLTIWAVWLLGRELFADSSTSEDVKSQGDHVPFRESNVSLRSTLPPSEVLVPLVAAALTTFLKIEILWSRQARPYQALQFFYLLSAYFLIRQNILGFLISGILASLMHPLGMVILAVGLVYLLVWGRLGKAGVMGAMGVTGVLGGVFWRKIWLVLSGVGQVNNLFYYRVFLWHNYSLLVFLALLGWLSLVFRKKKSWQILVLFLVVQGMIVSFLLSQPFVRYFYIVFPFLVLLAAAGLVEISRCLGAVFLSPRRSQMFRFASLCHLRGGLMILLFLTFFIIAMGNKFTLVPKKVYSLNEDMQEIPEVDYKKIYSFIEEKLDENPDAVYVSNWNDHPIWYLGEGGLDYLLRRQTKPPYDQDPFSGALYIKNLEEMRSAIEENEKGVILLESWDDQVPEDARKFIRQSLNKELEIDRLYPVQPRYWPVEIYSWGLEKK